MINLRGKTKLCVSLLISLLLISGIALAQTNVTLTKNTIETGPFLINETITFSINLTNNNGTTITDLFLYDLFNISIFNFTESNPTPDLDNSSQGELRWNITNLSDSESFEIEINFTGISEGTAENNATLFTTQGFMMMNDNITITINNPNILPETVTMCQELNTNHTTYVLQNDIYSLAHWKENYSWDCFFIPGINTNITLDCQGYKISGDGTASAIVVAGNNIEINNCNIQNVTRGLNTVGDASPYNIHFNNNTIIDFTELAISLNFVNTSLFDMNTIDAENEIKNGVELQYSYFNTFENNTFLNLNNYSYSMILIGADSGFSDFNVINNNTFNLLKIGVKINNGSDNNISNNVFVNSTRAIELTIDSSDNYIFGNELRHNETVVDDGTDNYWNLSSILGGGNNWTGFDDVMFPCTDANVDGFCDSPFYLNGIANAADFLPLFNPFIQQGSNFDIQKIIISSQTIYPLDIITFLINFTNFNGSTVYNLSIVDSFNYTHMNFTEASISPDETNQSTGELIWDIISLADEASWSVEVNFTALQTGQEIHNFVILEDEEQNMYLGVNETINITESPEDTTDPIWTQEPSNITVNSTQSIEFIYNATDNIAIDIFYTDADGNFSMSTNGTLTNATTLNLGTYYLNISVNDTTNNTISNPIQITIQDTANPTWLQDPSNTTLEYNTTLEIIFNATDNIAIDTYYTDADSNFSMATNGTLTNATILGIETYLMNISVNDSSGNSINYPIEITIEDTTPPTWTQVPSNITINNNENLEIIYNATDNLAIDTYYTDADGNFSMAANGTLTNATNLVVGVHYLNISVNDTANNSITQNINITVNDAINPSWIQIPANFAIEVGTALEIIYNATDETAIDTYYLQADGNFTMTTAGNLTNQTTLTIGTYYLNISVNDTTNNTITQGVNITIQDTTNPTWTQEPTNVSYEDNENIQVQFNATDKVAIDTYYLEADGNFSMNSTGFFINETTLNASTHYANISVNDTSGNTITTEIIITITDTTPPTWTQVPGDAVHDNANNFTATYNASDETAIDVFFIDNENFSLNASTGFVTNATTLIGGINYTINISVNDSSNNVISQVINITVSDTLIPMWIQTPVDFSLSNESALDIIYNATDETAIETYYTDSDGNFSMAANGSLTNATTLPEGNHTLNISVNDTSGNSISTEITIEILYVDVVNPVWTQDPSNTTLEYNTTLEIIYNATDNIAIDVFYTDADDNFSMAANGTLTNATTLTLGTYYLNISVNDTTNNTITYPIEITVQDTTNPTWTQVPENINTNNAAGLAIQYNATDEVGIDIFTVNDTTFIINSTGYLQNNTTLIVGQYNISITVNDTSNNPLTALINITVSDAINPVWTQIPGNTTLEYATALEIIYNATDNIAIDIFYTDADGNFSMTTNGTLTNATTLALGTYYLNISVNDTTNNTITQAINITIQDTANPTWIQQPTNVSYEDNENIQVQFNATDNVAIDTYYLEADENFSINTTGFFINETTLNASTHYANISVNDTSGNTITTEIIITITDTTPPTWTQVPGDTTHNNSDNYAATYNASDETALDIFFIDNENFSLNASTGFVTNATTLIGGINYTINISVNDSSNNIISQVINITVSDTLIPIWIQEPSNTTLEYNTALEIIYNATDETTIETYYTDADGNFSMTASGNLTNATTLALGTYYLNISVNDTTNNTISNPIQITIQDTTNPTWTQEPSNITINSTQSLEFIYNATDNVAVDTYYTDADGNFSMSVLGNLTNATSILPGDYSFNISVNDTSNNTISYEIIVTVTDGIYPEWTQEPSNVTLESNTSLGLQYNATDETELGIYFIESDENFSISTTGYLSNATELVLGIYNVNISVNDSSNNVISYPIQITVQDTTNPTWTQVPTNFTISNVTNLLVQYNATDNVAIDTYYIDADGNFSMATNGTLTNTTQLTVGNYSLTIHVNDTSNNTISQNFTVEVVYIDLQNPTWTQTPANFTINNVTTLEIIYNATDDVEIDTYFITPDGNFTMSTNGNLTNATNLGLNNYSINISVNDSSGNTISELINLEVIYDDVTAPVWTEIPANVSIDNVSTLVYQINATDDLELDTFIIDNGNFSINSTGYMTNATSLSPSNQSVNITVNDTSSNSLSEVINVEVVYNDITPPVISVVYPANGTNLTAGTTYTWINITTNELAVCRFHTTNSTFAFGDGTLMSTADNTTHYYNFTNGSALQNGSTYVIYYKCNDSSANVNSNPEVHIFSVNSTAIASNITTVELSDYVVQNATNVTATINITRGSYGIANVTANNFLLTNMTSVNADYSIWSGNVTLTDIGSPLTVVATDKFGLTAINNTVTYTTDDINPIIVITSPTNNSNISSTEITVVYNITETNFVDAQFTYSGNSSQNGTVTSSDGSFLVNLTEGLSQNITIVATDNASNTAYSYILLNSDRTAPLINSIGVSPNTVVQSGTEINITVNATDTLLNVTNVTLNNLTMTQIGDIWHYLMNVTTNMNLFITTYDTVGNNATNSSTTITVDDTAPIVNITQPINSGTEYNNSVIINWTINDTYFKNVSYKVDSQEYVYVSDNQTTINVSGGLHSLIVRAYDLANNAGYNAINFTVETNVSVNETIDDLEQNNPNANNFNLTDSDTGYDYTNNGSTNLTNITFNLTFNVNQTGNTTDSEVQFVNFEGYNANWDENFSATNESSNATANISGYAKSTVLLVSVNGAGKFLPYQSSYYGKVKFNVSLLNWTHVYYCSDDSANSCIAVSQCDNNNFTGVSDLNCFTNTSNEVSVYISHFSTIVLALDDRVQDLTIISPDNSSAIGNSTDVYFNFTIDENVTGNYTLDGNYTEDFNTSNTTFNFILNGTLNRSQLGTGILTNTVHNITIWLRDIYGNVNSTNYSFTINDSAAPQTLSNSTSGRTSTTDSGTYTFTANLNEYAYCWISSSNSAIDASTGGNMSAYTKMSGGLTKSPYYQEGYSSSETVTLYYSCRDIHGNNQSGNTQVVFDIAVNTGSTPSTSPTDGGGGGGGSGDDSGDTTTDNNAPIAPIGGGIVSTDTPTTAVAVERYFRNVTPTPATSLLTNENLKLVVEKLYSMSTLEETDIKTIVKLSEGMPNLFKIVRSMEVENGKTKVKTTIIYNGTRRLKNLAVFEIIPKEFAESSDLITLTALKGVDEVVNKDPEYLINFNRVDPREITLITYEVDGEIPESVLDSFITELYVEEIGEEIIMYDGGGTGGTEWITIVAIIITIIVAVALVFLYLQKKIIEDKTGGNDEHKPDKPHYRGEESVLEQTASKKPYSRLEELYELRKK